MKKRIINIFLFFLPMLYLFGCRTPAYVANTPHVPFFKKSSELQAEYNYGITGKEFKASYSLTDNIFTFGGLSYLKIDSIKTYRNFIYEGGLGYYHYFKNPFHIPFIIKINHLEVLAGYGRGESFGTFYNLIDSSGYDMQGFYNRYFIQLNLGISSSEKYLNSEVTSNSYFGKVIRLSWVDFYKFNYNSSHINKHINKAFLEFFLYSKIGFEFLNLQASAGFITPFSKNKNFDGLFLLLSVGVSLNFSL